MNLTPDQLHTILIAAICVIAVAATILMHRKETPAELMADVREEVLMMFLYAEKQDWVNKDKMDFVIQTFYSKFPAVVQLIIKETTVEDFVEKMYQDFKQYLIDGNIKDFHLKEDAAAMINPADPQAIVPTEQPVAEQPAVAAEEVAAVTETPTEQQ